MNPSAIVILGHQKSGTSAVAHLLADYGGLAKTIDIPETWWPNLGPLLAGDLPLRTVALQNRHRFSTALIKEPNLTFLFSQVRELHPRGQYVFVVRDPRDTIRSILNRLDIPGDIAEADRLEDYPISSRWRAIFYPVGHSPTDEGRLEHYIDVLAERWSQAAHVYWDHQDEMLLVRYEDFYKDKVESIAGLAAELGLERRHDISNRVNIPYQPRGDHAVSWTEFFGKANLSRIERRCGLLMTRFGYPPTSP